MGKQVCKTQYLGMVFSRHGYGSHAKNWGEGEGEANNGMRILSYLTHGQCSRADTVDTLKIFIY